MPSVPHYAVSSMGTVTVPRRVTTEERIVFTICVPDEAFVEEEEIVAVVSRMLKEAAGHRSILTAHRINGDERVFMWQIGRRLLWFGESDDELAKALHYIHGFVRMMCLEKSIEIQNADSS